MQEQIRYLIEFNTRHEWYEVDIERALDAVSVLKSQSQTGIKLSEIKERVDGSKVERETIRIIPLQ